MRLTLRTLLAYLDDTLDPGEIKTIGQKIAESDAAKEVIARIKQVTRRRRLTTPPLTGTGARFDPNTVAEYLDNALPAEQVNELEKTTLESDVHLAEIASCHQILTLILGEPALVPPMAKERMYGLVKGREAIPFRKAPSPAITTRPNFHSDAELDQTALLGLPMFRRSAWLWWALPAAALLLVASLGIALWMALPPPPSPVASNEPRKQKQPGKDGANAPEQGDTVNPKNHDKGKGPEADTETPKKVDGPKPTEPKQKPDPVKPVPEPPKPTEPAPPRGRVPLAPALTDRVDGGQVINLPDRQPTVLLVRDKPGDPFRRAFPDKPERARVFTNQTLICLPGYTSKIETPRRIMLTLRGNLPDFTPHPKMKLLQDVEIMLHKPDPRMDLDLTLDRGRILFTNLNDKKDVGIRLRFLDQQWDLVLKEGAEVAIDLIKTYSGDVDYVTEEPFAEVSMGILAGNVQVTVNGNHDLKVQPPGGSAVTWLPGPALIQWNSHNAQVPVPQPLGGVPPIWGKLSPLDQLKADYKRIEADFEKVKVGDPSFPVIKSLMDTFNQHIDRTKVMMVALDEMAASGILGNESKAVETTLAEQQQDKNADHRYLALMDLCSVGDVETLLAAITDEDPMHAAERDLAVFLLKRYMSRGLAFTRHLFRDDGKTKSGLLFIKFGNDGEKVYQLLNDFKPKDISSELYLQLSIYLKNPKFIIRQLAYSQLSRLSAGVKVPVFDPTGSPDERDRAANEWIKMVEDGKLPPKAAMPKP